jgi:hypothetical protein
VENMGLIKGKKIGYAFNYKKKADLQKKIRVQKQLLKIDHNIKPFITKAILRKKTDV